MNGERFAALRENFPNSVAGLNRNKCLALAPALRYAVLRDVALRELPEMHGKGPRMTTRIDRDGSLVTALRRGDPTAAEDLVATYGDRACRLATRITCNLQDAEEAVQDAFLFAIRKTDSFRGESAFGSWLYRIVANAAYQHCRRRGGRVADVSLDKLLPMFDEHGRHVAPVADWSMTVDDPARQMELRMVLSSAIAELPADYRVVELLRDVDGLSHQEIAETLGLSVVNVRKRVHRARLFLRKRLGAHLSIVLRPRPAASTPDGLKCARRSS